MARAVKKVEKQSVLKPKRKISLKFLRWLIPALVVVGVGVGLLVYFLTLPKENDTSEKYPTGKQILYSDVNKLLTGDATMADNYPHKFYIFIYDSDYKTYPEADDDSLSITVKNFINLDKSFMEAGTQDYNMFYILNTNIAGNKNIFNIISASAGPILLEIEGEAIKNTYSGTAYDVDGIMRSIIVTLQQ